MIPTATQVWLVVEAIDMRTGIDGLSQRIQNTLGRTPCDGSAYAFREQPEYELENGSCIGNRDFSYEDVLLESEVR
ncbi:IS66 family insertion sequence element accessory protein TnpB [Propionivibrio sp.]|uniref:IS66 family insertion sequence element accessory protein TnpB n=1 Tax=Propionivibrio sp. TaxID=2212460 RepID=UPI003BF3FA5B